MQTRWRTIVVGTQHHREFAETPESNNIGEAQQEQQQSDQLVLTGTVRV